MEGDWNRKQRGEDSEAERVAASDAEFAELRAASMAVGQHSWTGSGGRDNQDGFMVTDPDSIGGRGGDGDLNPGQLQVANERGEALGDYIQSPSFTLTEAHQRFVTSRETGGGSMNADMRQLLEQTLREVQQKEGKRKDRRERKRKRSRGPAKEDGDAVSKTKRQRTDVARSTLTRILNLRSSSDQSDSSSDGSSSDEGESEELVAEEMPGTGQWELGGLAVTYDADASAGLLRSDTESSCEDGWELGKFSHEDRKYIEERFGKHLKHARVPVSEFLQKACPLCTFLDNQHDAIGDRELQRIEHFIHHGMGNVSEYDHANLVAFMWNKNIYEPMKRERKRIFKLTAPMALAHITKPHRITKPALKLRDTRKLLMAEDCFWASTFSQNAMTQEPKVNRYNAQLALKSMELRWKILGVDDKKKPFPSADHNINPTKATRRVQSKQ